MSLENHVPDLDRCRRMAAVPALREAFKDSALVWVNGPVRLLRRDELCHQARHDFPAPLVDEMLVELNVGGVEDSLNGAIASYGPGGDPVMELDNITDPNALADACLAVAGGA